MLQNAKTMQQNTKVFQIQILKKAQDKQSTKYHTIKKRQAVQRITVQGTLNGITCRHISEDSFKINERDRHKDIHKRYRETI